MSWKRRSRTAIGSMGAPCSTPEGDSGGTNLFSFFDETIASYLRKTQGSSTSRPSSGRIVQERFVAGNVILSVTPTFVSRGRVDQAPIAVNLYGATKAFWNFLPDIAEAGQIGFEPNNAQLAEVRWHDDRLRDDPCGNCWKSERSSAASPNSATITARLSCTKYGIRMTR
jgi:hypothetical protein